MQWGRFLVACSMSFGALAAGCAAPVQVGAFKVNKEWMDRSFAEVKQRATFELGCPVEKLELTILNVVQGGIVGDAVSQIGVQGCEKKAVYVNAPNGMWVMNSGGASGK